MVETLDGSFPEIGGPQYNPQYTIIPIIGTPKRDPEVMETPR